MIHKNDRIYIAGHRGMVGSAIERRLRAAGYNNLLTRTHQELDLIDQKSVEEWFATQSIDHVFVAAARVGGINANNTYRGEFIYQNLMIQTNVVHAAWRHGVKRLLFLGSSCIYPRDCPQPMREEHLLTGVLEKTNEPYSIAKIAGLKLCEAYNDQYGTDFVALQPTNLYGEHDDFDLENSHVIPALVRKMHEAKLSGAKRVTVWGSGTPKREFLHVDDLADACVFVMEHDIEYWLINIGAGEEITIRALAELICDVVGYQGQLEFDDSMPDGTPRKLLDSSRINALGWQPSIPLRSGLGQTYAWYLEQQGMIAAAS